jgi:hypothetical protein
MVAVSEENRFLWPVMKTFLRKSALVLGLVGFVSALVVPAEAGRNIGAPPPIVIVPKPITSTP